VSVIAHPVNSPDAWSTRAVTYTDQWQACGWTRNGQIERFVAVLAAADPQPGETLLDYGCGTGAIVDLLPGGVAYTGFDTAPGMVHRATREHIDRSFTVYEPRAEFDVTVAVGPFNLRENWTKEHTWWALRGLWDRTRRVLAVSLYAGGDRNCLRYSRAEVAAFAAGETYHSSVRLCRANDLLMVLRR
jgi:trans-aconitate methyltransferase